LEHEALRMQVEDLTSCSQQCETMRCSNRQLLLSVLCFKEENEFLVVENRNLKEAVELHQSDLDNLGDRCAQLMGHTNRKQKIRYTIRLKDELTKARGELAKARSRVAHLEVARREQGIFGDQGLSSKRRGTAFPDAPTPLRSLQYPRSPPRSGDVAAKSTLAAPSLAASPASQMGDAPRATPRRHAGAAAQGRRAAPGAGAEAAAQMRLELEQVAHRCYLRERDLEKTTTDLQHLVAMLERAMVHDPEDAGLAGIFRELRKRGGGGLGSLAASSAVSPRPLEVGPSPPSVAPSASPCEEALSLSPRARNPRDAGLPRAQRLDMEAAAEEDTAERPSGAEASRRSLSPLNV